MLGIKVVPLGLAVVVILVDTKVKTSALLIVAVLLLAAMIVGAVVILE